MAEIFTVLTSPLCLGQLSDTVGESTEKFEANVVQCSNSHENLKRIFPGLGYGFL